MAEVVELGFVVHCVYDEAPNVTNFHTHGLKEKYDHLDLQIYFKMSPHIAMAVFCNLADHIKDGQTFEHGDVVSNVFGNYSVRLVSAKEGDRDVLRVIMPDRHGRLFPDEMDASCVHQYEGFVDG